MTNRSPATRISALVSDLDGTLVTSDKAITAGTRAAVAALRKAGLPFSVISSRPPRGMAPVLAALEVITPSAAFNGGAIVAPDGLERTGRIERHAACLVLSRQLLPTLDRTRYAAAAGVARGAYVLADARAGKPEVILIGTGSELAVCVEAPEMITREGVASRVVSMPSWELFEEQDAAWRESVLPASVTARVSVEAASPVGWDRYVGRDGARIAMTGFGVSAPAKDLFQKFGFTPDRVAAAARDQIARARTRT